MVGNPCTQHPRYRDYVAAILTQLETLDGRDITRTERLAALQDIEAIRDSVLQGTQSDENSSQYTPEERLRLYKELQERREGDNKSSTEQSSTPTTDPDHDSVGAVDTIKGSGAIRGMNQGKWEFSLTETEDGDKYLLDIAVGK